MHSLVLWILRKRKRERRRHETFAKVPECQLNCEISHLKSEEVWGKWSIYSEERRRRVVSVFPIKMSTPASSVSCMHFKLPHRNYYSENIRPKFVKCLWYVSDKTNDCNQQITETAISLNKIFLLHILVVWRLLLLLKVKKKLASNWNFKLTTCKIERKYVSDLIQSYFRIEYWFQSIFQYLVRDVTLL